jgi:hypothetical protein
MTLISTGTCVPLALVENDPMLLHLAVEDLCWRLAAEDLGKRRPGRGNRGARDAWRAEQECLVTETISAL